MTWNFRKPPQPVPGNGEDNPEPVFGRTDTGQSRPNNEDSFVILPLTAPWWRAEGLLHALRRAVGLPPRWSWAGRTIMMVADGMGGHKAGEVASRTSVEAMVHLLSANKTLRQGAANREEIEHLLIRALRETNDQIMRMACENEALSGMGSTFIVGFVQRNTLFTCHVGDVRAYLLTGQGLRQLTNDHSYLAEFKRTATSPNDQAPPPTMTRHVVSRAIGFPFPEPPDCTATHLTPNDRILLCSDGLWSMLPDPRLALILGESASPEEACERLIAEANQAGGKDNITAVVGFV